MTQQTDQLAAYMGASGGNSPLQYRPDISTDIAQPQLQVQARPVETDAPQAARDDQLNQLTSSLSQFLGGTDKLRDTANRELVQNEQEKAMMNAVQNAGQKPILDSSQSAWYQYESMKLYGTQQASDSLSALNQDIEDKRQDPNWLRSVDPQKYVQQYIHQNLAGITDPTVAQVAYPMMTDQLPRKVMELANWKREQLAKDLKQGQDDAYSSAFQMASSGLTGDKFTSQNIWSMFPTLVTALHGDKSAAVSMITQIGENEVYQGRNLGAAQELTKPGPDGLTLSMISGSKKGEGADNKINQLNQFALGKAESLQKDQLAQDQIQQDLQRKNDIAQLQMRISQGQDPTPQQWGQLQAFEQEPLMKQMIERDKTKLLDNNAAQIVAAGQADYVGTDKMPHEMLQKAYEANAGQLMSAPFDPKNPNAGWTTGAAQALMLHANGNTSLNVDPVKKQVDGVESDDNSNGVGLRTQKAIALNNVLDANPSLRPYMDKVFSPKTQEFLRIIKEKSTDLGVPGAVQFAQTQVTDENLQSRQLWYDSPEDYRGQVRTQVLKLLNIGNDMLPFSLIDKEGKQAQDIVDSMLTPFEKTAALTVHDPKQIAAMFIPYYNARTVAVKDPNTGVLGYAEKNRRFPVPDDQAVNGAMAPGSPAFQQSEYSNALVMGQNLLQEQYQKQYGDGHKWTIEPDFKNPNQVRMAEDGSLRTDLAPIPVSTIWQLYSKYSDHPGALTNRPKVNPLTEAQAQATAQAQVNKSYAGIGAANTAMLNQQNPSLITPVNTKGSTASKTWTNPYGMTPSPTIGDYHSKADSKVDRSAIWKAGSIPGMQEPPLPPPMVAAKQNMQAKGLIPPSVIPPANGPHNVAGKVPPALPVPPMPT